MTECAAVKSRWITVVALLIAAFAFAMSVWGGRWWSIDDVAIGPYGSTHCFGADCKHAGLGWIGGTERWMRTGMATWAGGVLSMIALLGVAGAIAARRVPRLAAKMTLVAISTTLLTGVAFIVQFPGVAGATIDRGMWMFVVGVISGLAATLMALRTRITPPAT